MNRHRLTSTVNVRVHTCLDVVLVRRFLLSLTSESLFSYRGGAQTSSGRHQRDVSQYTVSGVLHSTLTIRHECFNLFLDTQRQSQLGRREMTYLLTVWILTSTSDYSESLV